MTTASQKVFGIIEEDTLFDLPDAYWEYGEGPPEKEHLDDLELEYEEQFETGDHLTDDETCALLAGLGPDFTDERGNPLQGGGFRVIETMAERSMIFLTAEMNRFGL